jgi:hypothetical protein
MPDNETEMPQQVYACPVHGDFEITVRFDEQRPAVGLCPYSEVDRNEITRVCGRESAWRPSVPYVMGLDSATIKRHSYPTESGADGTRKRRMKNVTATKETTTVEVPDGKGRKTFLPGLPPPFTGTPITQPLFKGDKG